MNMEGGVGFRNRVGGYFNDRRLTQPPFAFVVGVGFMPFGKGET
jgi:hypothetical protein